MSDTLARICADKRTEIEARKQACPLATIIAAARAAAPPRGFAARLRAAPAPALICEIKKASPSRGLIRPDFDPTALARAYQAGGATCLSVLTDERYFLGHDQHLVAARGATTLPVLRKDFMLDSYQIVESRALGADCVLLILAALDDATANHLSATARDHGLDRLAEVHDDVELDRALRLDVDLIGINNRNLKTLQVDLATTERLAPRVPAERLLVAESGVRTAADIRRLQRAGAHAFLVGESLMSQADVAQATRALLAGSSATARSATAAAG